MAPSEVVIKEKIPPSDLLIELEGMEGFE